MAVSSSITAVMTTACTLVRPGSAAARQHARFGGPAPKNQRPNVQNSPKDGDRCRTPGARLQGMTALDRFSAPTRDVVRGGLREPTPAQGARGRRSPRASTRWSSRPPASGKTLSAFLWAIDRLLTSERPRTSAAARRVLYISPLKALGVDVERNLRAPLTGIRHTAERLGEPVPDITVGVRSGDTSPAADRRKLARTRPTS